MKLKVETAKSLHVCKIVFRLRSERIAWGVE